MTEAAQAPLHEVGVAIPCYNQAHYLGECLQSLVEQTHRQWRALVIDDRSPDHEQIAQVVAELGDPRVSIVRHEVNRGLAAARNTGYRESGAELLYCVDADDKLAPTCLEKLVAVLTADEQLDCAFPDALMFGSIERVLSFHLPPEGVGVLRLEDTIPGSGTMLRRRLWERLGGYDESEAMRAGREDYEFNLRAFGSGCKAGHVAEPLYLYRQAYTSMAEACRLKDAEVAGYILDKNRALFSSKQEEQRFLSRFCDRAARASHREYMQGKALRLALRAWRLDPSRLRLKALATALLPPSWHRAWRTGAVRRRLPLARYPLRGKQRYRPFFVVGAGQSGVPEVGALLGAHSQLYVPPPIPAVGTAVQKYVEQAGRLTWPDLLQLTLAQLEFKLNAETMDEWLGPVVTFLYDVELDKRHLAALLDQHHRFRARRDGCTPLRWGDATEESSLDDRLRRRLPLRAVGRGTPETLERLLRAFPDAQFIHVVRDGTEVVKTMLRSGHQRTLEGAARRWTHTTRQLGKFLGELPHGASSTLVRYEDLTSDPGGVARSLARFLEVEYEETMITPAATPPAQARFPLILPSERRGELQQLIGADLAALGYPACTERDPS